MNDSVYKNEHLLKHCTYIRWFTGTKEKIQIHDYSRSNQMPETEIIPEILRANLFLSYYLIKVQWFVQYISRLYI